MQGQTRVLLDFPFPNERVFRYQAVQDILHHLVKNPFEEFTQKELATITDSDVPTVSRAVERLEHMGVLDIKNGKPAQIRINQDRITGHQDGVPTRERPETMVALSTRIHRQIVLLADQPHECLCGR